MAVFEVGNGEKKSGSVGKLVPILMHRIRSTDSIGWLEDGQLGAVLPHTSPEGAWKFVANVRGDYNGNNSFPKCMVFVYPSSWISGTGITVPPDPHSRRENTEPAQTGAPDAQFTGVPEETGRVHPFEELGSSVLQRVPVWKRVIDIVGSLSAVILLSPLLLLVALFIRMVSHGPVLFRQERVGCLGKTFTLWKFRTMHADSDTTVHRDYLRELIHNEKKMTKLDRGADPRIIPFGALLRATGIDELPQLINVLQGDMSLVGPRPCLTYEAREYRPWHMRRFDVAPGLTGLWQVSGKNRTTFTEMMRLDIGYAKGKNLLLDLKIYLKTIPAIILQVADLRTDALVRPSMPLPVTRAGASLSAFLMVYFPRK